jgi:elongation factor Ts
MEITAKMVAELRGRTGLPMMKCKKALVAAEGDIDKAIDNLRKEGEKMIDKLSGREMKDGIVFTYAAADGATAVSFLCETEPVARSTPIAEFMGMVVKAIHAGASADTGTGDDIAGLKMSDGRTVGAGLDEFMGSTIRENMKIGAYARFKPSHGVVSTYVHHNDKIACLVELEGEGLANHDAIGALGKDLGMHLAFNSAAVALTRDGIDDAWIAKEREIFVAQVQDMPADKREKIAEGKLAKRLKDVVLLEQPFIKNEKESVGKHVQAVAKEIGTPVSIKRFARVAAGA